MKKLLLLTSFTAFFSLIVSSCVPAHTVKRQPLTTRTPPAEVREKEEVPQPEVSHDTLSYLIEFPDGKKRDAFIKAFNNFIGNYSFETVEIDSEKQFVHIRIVPGEAVTVEEAEEDHFGFSAIEKSRFAETLIEQTIRELDSLEADTAYEGPLPQKGGVITLYTHRPYFDEILSGLVRALPFCDLSFVKPVSAMELVSSVERDSVMEPGMESDRTEKSADGFFTITDSSQRRIELRLNGRLVNGAGQSISALDLIQTWSSIIRNNPAEGLALFRHVQGIEPFIRGEEPVIRGFYATDGSTVQLRMERADPHALERLRSSRLLREQFKIGPYYISDRKSDEAVLVPNKNSRLKSPYLERCVVKLGGDQNPILSYSLGRFNAMRISSVADIQYAQSNLSDHSKLLPLPSERYFLSCRLEDPQHRRFIADVLRPEDLLRNFVKAQGEAIQSVQLEQPEIVGPPGQSVRPSVHEPLRILYTSADPVSKNIAEKLLADLSNAGVNSVLNGADLKRYETLLLKNDYDIAVGWIDETVLSDISEQLRLATIWFDDITDPLHRVREFLEIPLFSINNYLLVRDDIHLYGGYIAGLFVFQEPEEEELPDSPFDSYWE